MTIEAQMASGGLAFDHDELSGQLMIATEVWWCAARFLNLEPKHAATPREGIASEGSVSVGGK